MAMTLKFSDLVAYLAMIPAVLTIVGTAIFMSLLSLTGVAAIVIGVGEWLAQN
jgi:hypothetical protein